MQGHALGAELLRNYKAATGLDAVPPAAVTVFSTNYSRTIDTVNALLIGLLPAAEDAGDGAAADGDCACRPDHGDNATQACVAECLGEPARKGLPIVSVRPASDAALHQTRACQGWGAYVDELKQGRSWTHAASGQFHEEWLLARKASGSREDLKLLEWPGGACVGCVHPRDTPLDFVESVRLSYRPPHCCCTNFGCGLPACPTKHAPGRARTARSCAEVPCVRRCGATRCATRQRATATQTPCRTRPL